MKSLEDEERWYQDQVQIKLKCNIELDQLGFKNRSLLFNSGRAEAPRLLLFNMKGREPLGMQELIPFCHVVQAHIF